jgi:murein DD-endopeptidase MepM/ murein hydrolase activator NlpD
MFVLACFVACLAQIVEPGPTGRLRGIDGGFTTISSPQQVGECVPPAVRAELEAAIARRESLKPPGAKSLTIAPLIPFPSLGGIGYEDVFPGIFVDVDPSFGSKNFSCHDFSYDGHRGHDIGLRSFGEQAIGVPVFAVRDGVVAFAQDGFADMNTAGSHDGGNYVIVDHGGGQYGWYFHLKKNSVAFTVGQIVKQGDQVGLAASSGNSFGPHLHFEVQQNGVAVEPFAGPCGSISPLAANQDPLLLATRALDFGVTTVDLFVSGVPHPFEQPYQAQVPLNAGFVYYWMQVANIPANALGRMKFYRPNGTLAQDTGDFNFGNTTFLRYWPGFLYAWVFDMQTIPGTWRVEVLFNGVVVINAPVEVVATVNPTFNRSPEPITASFESSVADPAAALFCRVGASVTLDDLDWDKVRYRYLWKVNGATIRDVTTAGRRDAIPRGSFVVGDTVSCAVTPNDGKVNGTTVTASTVAAIDRFTNRGGGKYGTSGVPYLEGVGSLTAGSLGAITLSRARPNSLTLLFLGFNVSSTPFLGGTLVPLPIASTFTLNTGPSGGFALPFVWPTGVPSGLTLALQSWIQDPVATVGAAASNGLSMVTP